jgi:Immune inhibitor A peptidase M6, catalytic domain
MPAQYRCRTCHGTINSLAGAPACPAGGGPMELCASGSSLGLQTGCYVQRQAQFKTHARFEARHFVPGTGRGKFDCSYSPKDTILWITQKYNLEFENTKGQPPFTAKEKLEYKMRLSSVIPAYWSSKCELRCTLQGYTDVRVTPMFRVEFDSPIGAHFQLKIQRSVPGIERVACVSLRQISISPETQDTASFQDYHMIEAAASDKNPAIYYEHETRRLQSVLKTAQVSGIEFAKGKSTLSVNVKSDLASFVGLLKDRVRGTPQIPIIVEGLVAAGEEVELAGQRQDAVKRFLETAAIGNAVEKAPLPGRAPLLPPQNKVVDEPPAFKPTLKRTSSLPNIVLERPVLGAKLTVKKVDPERANYSTVAHEFGHMLGLPDEYNDAQMPGREWLASKSKESQAEATAAPRLQRNYIGLCGWAHVVPPTFPSHTASMMSWGMVLNPRHFVTVLDALATLTHEFIPKEPCPWTIQVP